MLPYNFDAWIPGLIAFILVFKALITLFSLGIKSTNQVAEKSMKDAQCL